MANQFKKNKQMRSSLFNFTFPSCTSATNGVSPNNGFQQGYTSQNGYEASYSKSSIKHGFNDNFYGKWNDLGSHLESSGKLLPSCNSISSFNTYSTSVTSQITCSAVDTCSINSSWNGSNNSSPSPSSCGTSSCSNFPSSCERLPSFQSLIQELELDQLLPYCFLPNVTYQTEQPTNYNIVHQTRMNEVQTIALNVNNSSPQYTQTNQNTNTSRKKHNMKPHQTMYNQEISSNNCLATKSPRTQTLTMNDMISKQDFRIKKSIRNDESANLGQWTKEEHKQFLFGLSQVGENYKLISKIYVKTRSRRQIVNHAHKYLKKR